MPYVEKSIEISVPVEIVYRFVTHEPEHMTGWWPPIELQERITPPPTAIGSTSRYVYNMLGIRIKGEHSVADMVENRHLLVKTISGIEATFDFTFAALKTDKTLLTLRVNYAMPGTILGQLLNRMTIERRNADDLEQGLTNLKQMIEGARV
jgi:uncharacterized membrane protein